MFNINPKLELHHLETLRMTVEKKGMGTMDGVAILHMKHEGRIAQMRVVPIFKNVSFSFTPVTLTGGELKISTTSEGPTFEVGNAPCLGEAIHAFNNFWEKGFEGLTCKISKLHMFN